MTEFPYSLRPWSTPWREKHKDILSILISQPMMEGHGLENGGPCLVDTLEKGLFPARAYYSPEKIHNTVQTSQSFRDSYSLSLKDKVTLQKYHRPIEDVRSILLTEIEDGEGRKERLVFNPREREGLEWFLEYILQRTELVSVGLLFNETVKGKRMSFRIVTINSSSSTTCLYRFISTASVEVGSPSLINSDYAPIISRKGIGGLDRQLSMLDRHLEEYLGDKAHTDRPTWYRGRRKGVLLYGPPGTGKSLLLGKVSEVGWKKILPIDLYALSSRGVSGSKSIQAIVAEARDSQPSLILIDSLDAIAGNESALISSTIVSTLASELKSLGNARVLVLAAAQTLRGVDQRLRKRDCFGLRIEIPIPDSRARAEILKTLTLSAVDEPNDLLEEIADRTHGFVGEDLDELTQLAWDKAEDRLSSQPTAKERQGSNQRNTTSESINGFTTSFQASVPSGPTKSDWNAALLEVRPTAMQEVFLETPKVHWTDIGGQYKVKHALRQAVEWPYKVPPPSQFHQKKKTEAQPPR